MSNRFIAKCAVAFGTLCLALCASAQTDRTYLTGTVTDPQGNRVPDAKVLAVEDSTGLKRETQTT